MFWFVNTVRDLLIRSNSLMFMLLLTKNVIFGADAQTADLKLLALMILMNFSEIWKKLMMGKIEVIS